MGRFADALKRSRSNSILGPTAEEDRAGDPIRFFAPGQPAVVSPWDIEREPGAAAVSVATRHARRERAPVPRVLDRNHHSESHARFPSATSSDKLIVSRSVTPIAREQYNKLAAAIHQLQLERTLKVVMVTSAVPHEGKTLTAANVALTLSDSYERRVLLIDGDLRHPSVHGVLGIPNRRGLSDSLAAHGPLPVVELTPNLWVLTAGSSGGDPMKTLTSEYVRTLIDDARADFDWVLVDTPPIGLLPDAGLVASVADGALFVVRAAHTPYDLIQRAVEAIGADRILGVVLNGMSEHEVPAGYYGDYYYDAGRG
jgi:capsular exopolysaccharide synthesis family protein